MLQYLLTFLSSHFDWFDNLVKTQPTLLFYQGKYIKSAMRKHRVSCNEIESAIRKAGFADDSRVSAIIFESAGELSVIPKEEVSLGLVKELVNNSDIQNEKKG